MFDDELEVREPSWSFDVAPAAPPGGPSTVGSHAAAEGGRKEEVFGLPDVAGVGGDLNDDLNDGGIAAQQVTDALQAAVDNIFGDMSIKGLKFSLTVADPGLPDCPLVGCSDGFCDLTGYDMDSIVGRNCRFLIDPVPEYHVNRKVRAVAKDFIEAVRKRRTYQMPEALREPFMPQGVHKDAGVFCMQINARRNGTMFRNMFYMKEVVLDDRPYIIGLQAEVCEGNISILHEACRVLDMNMSKARRRVDDGLLMLARHS